MKIKTSSSREDDSKRGTGEFSLSFSVLLFNIAPEMEGVSYLDVFPALPVISGVWTRFLTFDRKQLTALSFVFITWMLLHFVCLCCLRETERDDHEV